MSGITETGTPRSLFTAAPARFLTREQCEAITRQALAFATADETRVSLSSGVTGNTRFAVNQISTAGDSYNNVVVVSSKFGRRSANAVTNKLDAASLKAVVERSEALAKLAPEDPEDMPELGPQQYQDTPGWSDATANMSPEARAAAVVAVTEQAKAAGLISTGYLEVNAGAVAVANNKGLFAYRRNTSTALTTTVRTPDGTGSGWAGASDDDWSRITPAALGARAVEKAKNSRNPVAIEPGRYTVVLEPTAVGNLVQLIMGSLNARGADEGRSFFSKPGGGTKLGMKVVDERVTIYSDPMDPLAPGTPFTGEGMPTKRNVWIDKGVVTTLNYDRFWAQEKGVLPTASGGGIVMSGGSVDLDQMIASTERGILITRLWYIRPVNPRTILFTGLTRDGTFLIENGKVTRPIKNMRWNESPIFLLNNIEAMGAPVRVSSSESGSAGQAVVVPPIKARDFNFTSLSDAV